MYPVYVDIHSPSLGLALTAAITLHTAAKAEKSFILKLTWVIHTEGTMYKNVFEMQEQVGLVFRSVACSENWPGVRT